MEARNKWRHRFCSILVDALGTACVHDEHEYTLENIERKSVER
jgi:hypothetical protein